MKLEEPSQMCSNRTKSAKKQKQKKIPQRGLGVAQLEKIRIEEQQKKIASSVICTYPPLVSPTNSSSLTLPLLNCPLNQSPPCSVAFTSPSPTSISSSHQPIILRPTSPALSVSVPAVDGCGHLHKMWPSYELNHGCSNVSLPFSGQFSQAAAAASSLMNIPLMNSPVRSNFQMEPPSNQNLYSNFSSLWAQEDKMAPAKRPSPFPLHMPIIPSFQSKLPRIAAALDQTIPFGNGSLFNAEHAAPIFHETPLMQPSSSKTEPTLKKAKKETQNQDGDFLTLAPSSVAEEEQVATSTTSAELNQEFGVNPSLNSELRPASPKSSGLDHRQPFFNFFPVSKVQQEPPTTNECSNSNGNGEVGDTVDLTLNL